MVGAVEGGVIMRVSCCSNAADEKSVFFLCGELQI
jgi:hypothetical protein